MSDSNKILLDRATALVEAAKKAGADAADAVVVRSASTSVSVREGKVEGTQASESDDFSLRVFCQGRVANVSAAASTDPNILAERAVAMAKVSPPDKFNRLADQDRLATEIADLDMFDATQVSAEEMTEQALATEAAAMAVKGVTKSSGASASAGSGGMVLVTSHGFSGFYQGSRFGRSASVIAGSGTAMERDYDFTSKTHYDELRSAADVGKSAGERTVERLNPRKVSTQTATVMFDPRVARGILGHISGAINGGSVARKSTFLREMMGKQVAASAVTIIDEPQRIRGGASRPFDGEGVKGETLTMIENGVLQNWFLSTGIADELGLQTNGRGARSGSSVMASSTNLTMQAGTHSPQELMEQMGTGFYVTELFGHGVDLVTGEYSRGASGFWIENGVRSYPVSEVTIASNLKDMFMRIVPANDLDMSFSMATPTLVIEGMTIAGT